MKLRIKESKDELTLKDVIKNAKRQANIDGYYQDVYIDKNGDYGFKRHFPNNLLDWNGEKLIGQVQVKWYNEYPSIIYVDDENLFRENCANTKCRKSIKESINLNDYKYKFNKFGYDIYSKMENGKAVYVAVKDGEEPFEITYDQVRGFEPINPMDRKLQHGVKKALKMESVYTDAGFNSRKDYLKSLADDYGVDYNTVVELAYVLGPDEDFDALVSEVEDLADDNDFVDDDTLTGLDWYLNEYNYVLSDNSVLFGFDKFEDAYDEVLQCLTRFDTNVTLYDTIEGIKTAYDRTKIDINKLTPLDYTDEEEDYYSYPYILFVKEIGGSDAVNNVKKALKMAEIGTEKI